MREFIHSERWARLSFGDQPPSSGVVILFAASSFATTSIRAFHSRLIADISSALLPGIHSSSLISHLLYKSVPKVPSRDTVDLLNPSGRYITNFELLFPVPVFLFRRPGAGSMHRRAPASFSCLPLSDRRHRSS